MLMYFILSITFVYVGAVIIINHKSKRIKKRLP